MARTLNPAVHAVRRDAILDVAERLIRTKGYEQMSVQEIQNELEVSRGAIYHYFDSKAAILEAVIERISDTIIATLTPIAEDPDLPAVAKLQQIFSAAGRWKTERRELMLALLDAWYSDDNAIVRERLRRVVMTRLPPILAVVIRQGTAEGTMSAASADDAAQVLVALIESLGDAFSDLLLAQPEWPTSFEKAERRITAYSEAVERIIGLRPGSFELMDAETMHFWFD